MAHWHLDEGLHLDQSVAAEIEGEGSFELDFASVIRAFDDLEIVGEIETSTNFQYSVFLDLLRLVPFKFHQPEDKNEIFVEYIREVELEVGIWLTRVRDMVKLANPNTVTSRAYLNHLASLIGLELPPEDTSTEDEIRRSIAQAIDWYKVKGTYESVNIISLIQQYTANLFDMYTNDYVTFLLTDWFVGEENENPPGLDSSYYKSPHFGVEVVLDRTYSVGTSIGSGSGASGGSNGSIFLWQASYLDNLFSAVEQTRPVHTVPHYILLLSPSTDEFGNVITVAGNIQTRVLTNWQVSAKYFDENPPWNFDDGENFDASVEAFIQSITKWELGTGSNDIRSSSWTVANPVLTGSIDLANIVISQENVEFSFIVPKAVAQNGITELGLYTSTNDLVLGSVFPALDKDGRVELRVVVTVQKKNLGS
jgi:hypothetical protein